MFNLLQLHDPNLDMKPYSWIEINGKGLIKIIDKIVENICNNNRLTKREISEKIGNKIGCHYDNIAKRLYKTKGYDWYPIPFILELLELDSNSKGEKNKILLLINSKIDYLRCGRNSKNCKAIKTVTANLAKLCGAIAADGHLFKDKDGKEGIVIIDEYKDSIHKCNRWLEETFNFCGRLVKSRQNKAWILFITSKVVTRFFNKFLEIPYGKKSNIVKEPISIKESRHRLDFAKGVILMDGSVELDYRISLGVTSKSLAEDIFEILKENDFKVKFSYNNSVYKVRSLRLDRIEACKWINFFGLDIEKGRKLYQMTYKFTKKPSNLEEAIQALNQFCKISNSSKITIKEIFDLISNNKKITKKMLANKLKIDTSTLYKYLWLLEKAKVIKVIKTTGGPNRDNLYFYNDNIKVWSVPDI